MHAKAGTLAAAHITEFEGGIRLVWSYGKASIERAAVNLDHAPLTAAFPDVVSFTIVDRRLARDEYRNHLEEVLRRPQTDLSRSETPLSRNWIEKSQLEIRVNGLESPRYVFDVTRIGVFEHAPHLGAYDEPTVEYSYALFRAALRGFE